VAQRQGRRRSLLVIAFNSFVGRATRFATASIDWSVVGLAGGLVGNTAAAMLVGQLDQRRLKRIFAVFILAVGYSPLPAQPD
jgi:uncharacterized membrane protein YfcA